MAIEDIYGILSNYAPAKLDSGYGLRMWQGYIGKIATYGLKNAVEVGEVEPQWTVADYKLRGIRYPLLTWSDLTKFQETSLMYGRHAAEGDVSGRLAERVAWANIHSWLSHSGFAEFENEDYQEGHIFAHSEDNILKVKRSPNLVLLEKQGKAYEVIKEIDGLFVFRSGDERYVVVNETKVNEIPGGIDNLASNLFDPLRTIYGDAHYIYLVYSSMEVIYSGGSSFEKRKESDNKIRPDAARVYETLLKEGVGTMFFGFREPRNPIGSVRDSVLDCIDLMNHDIGIETHATVFKGKIIVWPPNDTGEPLAVFQKTDDAWKSMPIKKRKS
ncbi:MAG: hypothetical protein HGA85_04560 [Nanoarchaeota archaeon]|nr:hypothetical protein [Nanoarchaeota archaeon]